MEKIEKKPDIRATVPFLCGPGPDAGLLQAYWSVQPRGVRIFTEDLEVHYDNVTDRSQTFPVYTDGQGAIVPLPPEGEARAIWPVYRALTEDIPNQREYAPRGCRNALGRFRVSAVPFVDAAGRRWIVEEIEKLDSHSGQTSIQALESSLTDLLSQLCQMLSGGSDFQEKPIRLENPHLRPCYEIKKCERPNCPAYRREDNLRCWEIDGTFCPDGASPQNTLEKIPHCVDCEVLLLACPDSRTHVWEQINQLLHMLQIKSEELQKAYQFVQRAERASAVAELTMGIVHEIKNPLSVILSRLDCLALELDTLSSNELAGDLETIHAHAVRMRHILDEFLGLVRATPMEFQPLPMPDLVSEVLNMTRKTLEKADVRVSVDLPQNLPFIRGDRVQIEQVLMNLLLNARDAMPQGGDISIRARNRNNGQTAGLTLTVRDTGEGISPELQKKIFSPLYTTKSDTGGTGLGLAVCRRIMTRHEGTIAVESAAGKGAAFHLWFPAARSAS